MKEVSLDIFSSFNEMPEKEFWKFCPTNGTINSNGEAVMGRGIAKQLKDMYPAIPKTLATQLRLRGNTISYLGYYDMSHWWSFPVKHNWQDKANVSLISFSLMVLKSMLNRTQPFCVLMPRVGCGNGKLDWVTQVRPMFKELYPEEFCKFTLFVNKEV